MASSVGLGRLSRLSSVCRSLSGILSTSASHMTGFVSRNSSVVISSRWSTIGNQHAAALHTSAHRWDLMEFFDKKDNWGEQSVRVGRPWKKDELRLKSNEDLHKLWYVLLKERNMLMTMAEEYKRQSQLLPNPERLEKVEESMENILEVVAERDRALTLLETGECATTGPSQRRWAYNELGIGYWHKCTEHRVPLHVSRRWQRTTALSGPWQHKFIKLRRERMLTERRKKLRQIVGRQRAMQKAFPNAEIDVDLSEFTNTLTSKMKGPTA